MTGVSRSASTLPPLLRMSPVRAVWAVAWPMIAVGMLKTAYFLTDSWFIGRLGDAALAAAGGVAFAWWMQLLACEIAAVGTQTLVARHEGAGTGEGIAPAVVQGLWVGLAVAVVLMATTPLAPLYFDALGFAPESDEYALGTAYLAVNLFASVVFAAHVVVDAAFRGIGATRTSLLLMILTVLLNAGLDPLLIWGFGPIPALGIAGAAWATVVARGMGAVVGVWLLARAGHVLVPAAPVRAAFERIVRIGLPVSARGIAFALVYVVLGRFITHFGPENMAALGLGHRFEGLGFNVGIGFEVGAATLVGQHLGARDPDGALRAANTAAKLCAALVLPISVLLYFAAEPLFALFASEPATIAAGVIYLRIQTLVFVFMGIESVYEGAFAGTGRTVPAFWIGAIGTAARLPLAWGLAFTLGMGATGIWIAVALSTLVKGVAQWYWFQRRGWEAALDDEASASPAPIGGPGVEDLRVDAEALSQRD